MVLIRHVTITQGSLTQRNHVCDLNLGIYGDFIDLKFCIKAHLHLLQGNNIMRTFKFGDN